MKTLKNIVQESPGFRFLIDGLQIMSPSGKKLLLNQRMMTSGAAIEKELGLLEQMVQFIENKEYAGVFDEIGHKLFQLKDIHATLSNLANRAVLDDIDLFEIKQFALLSEDIAALLRSIQCHIVQVPDLEEVVKMLDPEGQRIPHFYIYAAYSTELGEVRRQMKAADGENREEWRQREQALEEEIRVDLSRKLLPFSEKLNTALKALSYADLLIAKARQALEMGLCRPEVSDDTTGYEALFNPAVKALLEKENKTFQPVDILLHQAPTLVTGANMGGKTVLLKTVYLAQHLFQFGFFVPAKSAKIVPVGELMLSHGENQPEWSGLSSFAFEMLNINKIISAIRGQKKVLALIDELARTTNPDEGKAIVNATLDILSANRVCSIITTHYSGIEAKCRKLKVKGLMTGKIEGNIPFENLNDLMDYSLVETENTEASSDGIRIAEIMGVDEELIERAKRYFKWKK